MADGQGDVIVISDESEEESDKPNVRERPDKALFNEYVVCCHELMSRIRDEQKVHKIEKHLLKVYKAARPDYASSEEFRNTLRQQLVELRQPGAKDTKVFACIHAVIIHLKGAAASPGRGSSNGKVEGNTSELEKTKKSTDSGEPISAVNPVNDSGHENDAKAASTSYPSEHESREPHGSGAGGGESSSVKEKYCKIRRLEKLMGRLDKEIRRYSEKELSLDDMLEKQSSHITEHKLRKRFVEAWQKWCKMKGYKARTGRPMERKLKFQGTRYPEINSKVQRLIRENGFPDFHDVHRLVKKVDSKSGLGIVDIHRLSQEIFEDIGQLFRRRRCDEFMSNPGYGPWAGIPEDPAEASPELKRQLEDNATLGKKRMDAVLETYTMVQNSNMALGVDMEVDSDGASNEELGADENQDSSSDDDDDDVLEAKEGDKVDEDTTVNESDRCKDVSEVTSREETAAKVDDAQKKRKHDDLAAASSSSTKEIKLDHDGVANHKHAHSIAETTLSNGEPCSAGKTKASVCEPPVGFSSRTRDTQEEGASVSHGSTVGSDSKGSSVCGNDNQTRVPLLPSALLKERQSITKTQSADTCARDSTRPPAGHTNGFMSGTKPGGNSRPVPQQYVKKLAPASGKAGSATSTSKEGGSTQAGASHQAPQGRAHAPGVKPTRRINTVPLMTSTPIRGRGTLHPAQIVRRQTNGVKSTPTADDGDDEVIVLD
ncbi:uncharacterized protein [Diadema antillarum]|uniref:uncharacterized protein n=1 Tax=Diadema antillarum TaxID=105358 RepID=UPI003A8C4609